MQTVIEIEHLSKVYKKNLKEIPALRDVSFQVQKNRILGILGPNGAGKTTLLKIITGIASPTSSQSRVELLGTENIDSIKHKIGFLPENPEFFRNITAFELLAFSLKISGAPFQRERIEELLVQVNLGAERNERIKHFSKGMRQRIGIAQAVIHKPELLILDEPMSGLDPPGRRMVKSLIDSYYKEGKTILFSTHNLDDIEALCTDVMVLNKGKIMLEKNLSQLREKSVYQVEMEKDNRKTSVTADNPEDLWAKLDQAKKDHMRIIKVQSGIAKELENFYENQ